MESTHRNTLRKLNASQKDYVEQVVYAYESACLGGVTPESVCSEVIDDAYSHVFSDGWNPQQGNTHLLPTIPTPTKLQLGLHIGLFYTTLRQSG